MKPICTKRLKQRFCALGCYSAFSSSILAKDEEDYLKNPRFCAYCNQAITWRKDKYHLKAICCSQRCSGKYNVGLSSKRGLAIVESLKKKKIKNELKFNQGKILYRHTLKKYLIQTQGHICSKCHLMEWNNQPIPIEVDHMDGNSSNNMPVNLRLLCATCHAQMPTSQGKNRGKGRASIRKGII